MGKKMKCTRIDIDQLRNRIIDRCGDFAKASKMMKRSHDYVAGMFREYKGKVEFPERYLLEINQKLGIEYRDLIRKNNPRCTDNQICFDDLNNLSEEQGLTESEWNTVKDVFSHANIIELIESINALTKAIENVKSWRIGFYE